MSFFSSVGYPIPSQTDINDFLANDQKQRLEGIIDTVFKDGKISYPDYFWSMSGLFKEDDPMLKQLLLEIVDLTKDDKYNQTRLDAENELKKIGVNVAGDTSGSDSDNNSSATANSPKVSINGTPKRDGMVTLDISGVPNNYAPKTLQMVSKTKTVTWSYKDAAGNNGSALNRIEWTGFTIPPEGSTIGFQFDKTNYSGDECQFVITYDDGQGHTIQAKSDKFSVLQ